MTFADVTGWTSDDLAAALPALALSCPSLTRGTANPPATAIAVSAEDWSGPCADLLATPPADARRYFEQWFTPVRVRGTGGTEAFFTGYYEPHLRGSLTRTATYNVPLYRRPADLITVDLGAFRQSLAGEHISGRVAGTHLVPYPSRADIEAGALVGKAQEICWVDDPVDAFFLAVQGSGRVALPDGSELRLGYDGENGRPYVAIGQVLVRRGEPAAQMSMPFIRDWIAAHGADGTALMDENPSFIFYRVLTGPGPLGAEGVALTADRSAAIDPRFTPLGAPIFVSSEDPVLPGGRIERLFIAQDTGGAIKGAARADLFFGDGPEAGRHAGLMKGHGALWVLIPTSAARRLAPQS